MANNNKLGKHSPEQTNEYQEQIQYAERLIKNRALIKALKKETDYLQRKKEQLQSDKWKRFLLWLKKHLSSAKQLEIERLHHKISELEQVNQYLHAEQEKGSINPSHSDIDFGMISKEQLDTKFVKKYGDVFTVLDQLGQYKNNVNQSIRGRMVNIVREYQHTNDREKQFIYQYLLKGLFTKEVPEFVLRQSTTCNKENLFNISFREQLTNRIRLHLFAGDLPEKRLDDKWIAYQLMDVLNIPRPWHSQETYSCHDIPKTNNIVIKPLHGAGSRGVYIVYREDYIIDLKRNHTLFNWQAMLQSMEKDLEQKKVTTNEWYMEELIYESAREQQPARDLKFYSFLGEIPLILEIIRQPELKYCWWRADGERLHTGKYDDQQFQGLGVSDAELEMVKQISSKLPVPFIRIDFLRTENGLVFGEFTTKPGNYDAFTNEIDNWLGQYFMDALVRLTRQLTSPTDKKAFKQWFDLLG